MSGVQPAPSILGRWTLTERCSLLPDHYSLSVVAEHSPSYEVRKTVEATRDECPVCGASVELETEPARLDIGVDA